MINSILIVAAFLLGTISGARAITYGLAGLLAILAVTSSLPFQLGLPNVALIPVFLLALIGVASASGSSTEMTAVAASDRRGRQGLDVFTRHLRTWTGITVVTIFVASILGILGRHLDARPRLDGHPADLFLFAPAGLPGEIQTGYIALMGPLLFVVALGALRDEAGRLLLRRAFTAGICVAVLSPLVQVAALTPWVRPDQRTYEGTGITGLVGFFQDPHSYAAFLVFATTFCFGLAIGHARGGATGHRREGGRVVLGHHVGGIRDGVIGYGLLGTAAAIVFLYTNSRAGLVSILVSLAMLSLLALSSPTMTDRARRWRRAFVAVVALSALFAVVVLSSAALREVAYEQLAKLGNPRMWEIVRSDPFELLAGRTARLQKAAVILQTNPIWGLGPNGYQLTPIAIAGVPAGVLAVAPHNYFVQLATEYGLPAAASFLVLIGLVLRCAIGGAYRATEPLDRGLLAGISSGLVAVLLMSLVSHPLLLSELQAVFWTMSALAVATVRATTADQSRSSRSRPASKPKNGIGGENDGAPPPA